MAGRRPEVAQLLRERIYTDFHLGLVEPGTRLPTVRQLAREFHADPRVVLAACHDLEVEGIIEIRDRSGIYVAQRRATDRVLRRRGDWIVDLFLRGLRHGIPAHELPERLRRALGTLRLRVGCTECNADQIEELCHELQTSYGLESVPIDCEEIISATRFPPELANVDLVVTTHFHVREIESVVQRLKKPLFVAAHRTALFMEIQRLLTLGPVYVVIVDVRLGTKLKRIFTSAMERANLHLLVVGPGIELALSRIPSETPVYVTYTARKRLGGLLPSRTMPELRSFSPESALPILSFVVRANLAVLESLPPENWAP